MEVELSYPLSFLNLVGYLAELLFLFPSWLFLPIFSFRMALKAWGRRYSGNPRGVIGGFRLFIPVYEPNLFSSDLFVIANPHLLPFLLIHSSSIVLV